MLGAYERGERAISVPRLHRLAAFYNVPVDQLLPRDDDDGRVVDLTDGAGARRLTRLGHHRPRCACASSTTPGADLLMRYLQMIQVQRQDFNGRMLTIRRDDLRAIACILDTSVESAVGRARVPRALPDRLTPLHAGAVRRLPPHPVLRPALRLLRLRHLDRPRATSIDDYLDACRSRHRAAPSPPACRRRRACSSAAARRRSCRPPTLVDVLDADPPRRRAPRSPSSATPTP